MATWICVSDITINMEEHTSPFPVSNPSRRRSNSLTIRSTDKVIRVSLAHFESEPDDILTDDREINIDYARDIYLKVKVQDVYFPLEMASRLIRTKATVTGLRSVQNLSSLAVPSTLEQVPEDSEIKSKSKIFASDDWKSVDNAVKRIFKNEDLLAIQGEFFKLHQNVENILRSKTGTFLSDCYKEWITKEMIPVIGKLKRLDRSTFLQRLEDIWTSFYSKILPLLEAIFYQVKPKGRLSIRCTTLVAFRDVILLSSEIEEAVPAYGAEVSPEIRRMILLLQNVNDSYPPSKNKIRMESLAARICSPFMGYMGMYQNGHLVVTSSEPMHAARRRPSAVEVGGPRRISRPFSVQPHQMDTLNELFKTAVRHQDRK